MKIKNRFWLFLLLLLVGFAFISARRADSQSEKKVFGMIMETQGAVSLSRGGKNMKVKVMMPLYSGDLIKTGKNGKLTYVKYANGKEYNLESNSTLSFKGNLAVVRKGKMAISLSKNDLPLPKNTELKSRRIMGQVMRAYRMGSAVEILEPQAGDVLTANQLKVRWKGISKKYRLTVAFANEAKDSPRFEKDIDSADSVNEYNFSKDKKSGFSLAYGGEYWVEISGFPLDKPLDNGRLNKSRVYFKVLPREKAELVLQGERNFNNLLKKDPKDFKAYLLMAELYKENGMYNQSATVMEKVRVLDPQNPYVYYYLGEIYEKMGKSSESTSNFRKGLKLEQGK